MHLNVRFAALRTGGILSTKLDTKHRTQIYAKSVKRSTACPAIAGEPRLTQNRCSAVGFLFSVDFQRFKTKQLLRNASGHGFFLCEHSILIPKFTWTETCF